MTSLKVTILREGDPPPHIHLRHEDMQNGMIAEVIGIEAGTITGKPSVAFLVHLDGKRYVFAETTYELFKAAAAALHGAFE